MCARWGNCVCECLLCHWAFVSLIITVGACWAKSPHAWEFSRQYTWWHELDGVFVFRWENETSRLRIDVPIARCLKWCVCLQRPIWQPIRTVAEMAKANYLVRSQYWASKAHSTLMRQGHTDRGTHIWTMSPILEMTLCAGACYQRFPMTTVSKIHLLFPTKPTPWRSRLLQPAVHSVSVWPALCPLAYSLSAAVMKQRLRTHLAKENPYLSWRKIDLDPHSYSLQLEKVD